MTRSHEAPPADDINNATRQAKRSNGGARQRSRFKLIHVRDIHYDPMEDHWLIDGLLPMTGLATIWGKYKATRLS
jgi:hypothetical protein